MSDYHTIAYVQTGVGTRQIRRRSDNIRSAMNEFLQLCSEHPAAIVYTYTRNGEEVMRRRELPLGEVVVSLETLATIH